MLSSCVFVTLLHACTVFAQFGPFLLSYQLATNNAQNALSRRQTPAEGYITLGGKGTEACHSSALCFLDGEGRLSADNGTIYSTDADIISQPFAPSSSIGSIATTWQLEGGLLQWINASFSNNAASLCIDTISDTVEVYFLTIPSSSCIPIALSIAPRKCSPAHASTRSLDYLLIKLQSLDVQDTQFQVTRSAQIPPF